ncbi:MAG: chitobiase/beta-hexosaminidase C-terminal domain-containing protein, partial [Ignavibacteriae bacterium]|nr:chitobiase/beta-hexosaminidase C-terminal domain-containing protein [Ignavibacteriota bacterium]
APNKNSKIYLLGYEAPLVYSADESGTIINLPEGENQFIYPICLKITGKENKVVETPKVIINNEKVENTFLFQNEVEINFETIDQNTEIRYTLDCSEPTTNSTLFNSKIKLNETTLLKARAFNKGYISSPIDSIKLYKIKSVKEVNLKNSPSEKYENLGKLSLADGKRGSENYDDNTWLGFEGANFEATVDLGEIKKVNDITLGCLSNLNSWIFLPKKTSFFVSNDNQNFKKIKEINYEVLKTESQKSFVKDISARVNNKTRYIKVVAENIGECPVWHKGSGGKAWLFIDEIIVN